MSLHLTCWYSVMSLCLKYDVSTSHLYYYFCIACACVSFVSFWTNIHQSLINVVSPPLYNILLPPPQIGLTKDTLFVNTFHWDHKKVDEEEVRTNKCSCLKKSASKGWSKYKDQQLFMPCSLMKSQWLLSPTLQEDYSVAYRLPIQCKICLRQLFHNGEYKSVLIHNSQLLTLPS